MLTSFRVAAFVIVAMLGVASVAQAIILPPSPFAVFDNASPKEDYAYLDELARSDGLAPGFEKGFREFKQLFEARRRRAAEGRGPLKDQTEWDAMSLLAQLAYRRPRAPQVRQWILQELPKTQTAHLAYALSRTFLLTERGEEHARELVHLLRSENPHNLGIEIALSTHTALAKSLLPEFLELLGKGSTQATADLFSSYFGIVMAWSKKHPPVLEMARPVFIKLLSDPTWELRGYVSSRMKFLCSVDSSGKIENALRERFWEETDTKIRAYLLGGLVESGIQSEENNRFLINVFKTEKEAHELRWVAAKALVDSEWLRNYVAEINQRHQSELARLVLGAPVTPKAASIYREQPIEVVNREHANLDLELLFFIGQVSENPGQLGIPEGEVPSFRPKRRLQAESGKLKERPSIFERCRALLTRKSGFSGE